MDGTKQQALSPDEMYGMAKKINRELEAFPLHTHGALIQLVNIGFEHRKIDQQRAEKLQAEAMQRQAIENERRQIELAEKMQQARDAEALTRAQPATETQQ